MFIYLLFKLAAFLARHLPLRWGYTICRGIGSIIYRVSPVAWAARDNARHILEAKAMGQTVDPKSVSRLAKQIFQSQVMNYYDMLRLSSMPAEELKDLVNFGGLEYVDKILASGTGLVLTSAHFGPMEILIQCTAQLGYPLVAIAERLKPDRLHDYMMQLRTAHGLELIPTDGPLLEAYRRLKRGEILASALDRDTTDTGLIVPFLGAPAWVPDGYARIAVRTNLPVVLGYGLRTGQGVLTRLHPPLYPNPSLPPEEAVTDLVRQVINEFEGVIRTYPEQWLLSSPIWHLAAERSQKDEASE